MGAGEKVTALTEGALMAALAAVLALTGIYFPPLEAIINVIWTLPITVVVVRQDLRTGIMATAVAGILVGLLGGWVRAFFLLAQFGATGWVYGYLFKKEVRPGITVAAGTLAALASLALTLFLSSQFLGLSLGQLRADLNQIGNQIMEFYQRSGMLEGLARQGTTPEELRRSLENVIAYLQLLLPAILATMSFLTAFLNYLVAEAVLRRLNLIQRVLPPFRYWQLPWYALWGVILGLALWLGGDYWQVVWLKTTGLNLLYLYLPLLAGNGLAALSFLVHKFRSPALKVAILLAFLINIPWALLMLVAIGLFDPFLGWRKPERSS